MVYFVIIIINSFKREVNQISENFRLASSSHTSIKSMNCFQSLVMVSAFMVTHSTYQPESPTLTGETFSDSDLYRILLQKIGPLPFISIFGDLSHYPAKLNTFWQKPYFNILALPHPHLRFGHTKQFFTKTQLHFPQTIPQVRIKPIISLQQTNCLNIPLYRYFIYMVEVI